MLDLSISRHFFIYFGVLFWYFYGTFPGFSRTNRVLFRDFSGLFFPKITIVPDGNGREAVPTETDLRQKLLRLLALPAGEGEARPLTERGIPKEEADLGMLLMWSILAKGLEGNLSSAQEVRRIVSEEDGAPLAENPDGESLLRAILAAAKGERAE